MNDATRPPDALRTIFTQPRPTMRWLVDHGEGGAGRWLFMAQVVSLELLVVSRIGPWAAGLAPGGGASAVDAAFALYALALAAIAAVAWCPAVALATRVVGGRAPARVTVRALVWGQAPLSIALPALLVASIAEQLGACDRAPIVAPLFLLFGAWSLALSAVTLAEANRLPVTRTALALLGALFLTEIVVATGSLALPRLLFGVSGGIAP